MATKSPGSGRVDFGSLLGGPIAIGLILVGQAIEGGSVRTLLQLAAALVVFGGTFGAVLLSFGSADVKRWWNTDSTPAKPQSVAEIVNAICLYRCVG